MNTSKTPVPWAPTRPLERGNAAQRLLEDLKSSIVTGLFARGSRLPTERELAAGYGVSGATVREAVRGLAASGLVEVRHGSGAYVTGDPLALIDAPLRSLLHIERVGVTEVLSVLGALNMHAAEMAATRASKRDIQQLRNALHVLGDARDADDLSTQLRHFLHTVCAIAGNPLLETLCGILSGLQVELAMQLSGGTLEQWRETVHRLDKERKRLVDAIAERDPAAARDAARAYHHRAISVISALPHGDSARLADPLLASLVSGTPPKSCNNDRRRS